MSAPANIVITGQSGQGVILLSKILAEALHRTGLEFLATEYPAITHRFAITSAHVRAGQGLISARIRPREADLILGLEPFECLRTSLLFAHPGTVIVTNDTFIRVAGEPNHLLVHPIATETVDDIVATLKNRGLSRVTPVPATRLSLEATKHRAGANMVLLGAAFASGGIPAGQETLEEVIAAFSPRDTGAVNREGFRAGVKAYRAALGEPE
jgi:indolepyruvate ferredoxin oxidoreductase beta subunit